MASKAVDYWLGASNNLPMKPSMDPSADQPVLVRRVKSYSAASGYVYQYQFHQAQKSRRGFSSGNEYIYMVTADRKNSFPVRIFVRRDAVEKWIARTGRQLTGTEEYAAAKMLLFQAFDQTEDPIVAPLDLVVDDSNLAGLLASLDIS
jgi:hypothetical protein